MAKEFAYGLDAIAPDSMMDDDLEDCIQHLDTLLDLCKAQLRAMRLRADGVIPLAKQFEDQANALYQCLPEKWRW